MCDLTDRLNSSIQSLSFSSEIATILDEYLDPVLDKAPFLPESITNSIKSAIVSEADSQVNHIKALILDKINDFASTCSSRRNLGEVEISHMGYQHGRFLANDDTFEALSDAIESITGVVRLLVTHFFNIILRHLVLFVSTFIRSLLLQDTSLIVGRLLWM